MIEHTGPSFCAVLSPPPRQTRSQGLRICMLKVLELHYLQTGYLNCALFGTMPTKLRLFYLGQSRRLRMFMSYQDQQSTVI